MVHAVDQAEGGKQLTPHYWDRGNRFVCGGMTESKAEEYKDRLQKLADQATKPFIFVTYSVEKEYPEQVV
jgi:hypothetical protein